MNIPQNDILKQYGFENYTTPVGPPHIETRRLAKPDNVLNGVISVLDTVFEYLGVEHNKARSVYGNSRLNYGFHDDVDAALDGQYSFTGKSYEDVRGDLLEFKKSMKSGGFGFKSIKGFDGYGFFSTFVKVDDLIGAVGDGLLGGGGTDDYREDIEDNLYLMADLDSGGLLYSTVDLSMNMLEGLKYVKLSADVCTTLFYNKADADEIEMRKEEMKKTIMKDSPVRIESGYVPGSALSRIKVHGKVVEVSIFALGYDPLTFMLQSDGKIKYFYRGQEDVVEIKDLDDLPRIAFEDMRILDYLPEMNVSPMVEDGTALLSESSRIAKEWEVTPVRRRHILDAWEKDFSWVKKTV